MIRVEGSFIKREVFYRIYRKIIIAGCFFAWWSMPPIHGFELKECREIGQKGERAYFRCDIVYDESEEGLYQEGFECSLIHPHCQDIRYKVDSSPTSRYITSFKKQRQLYTQHMTLFISCQLSEHFDASIPIMLLVSSIVLYTNGDNKAQVKVVPCVRKKREEKNRAYEKLLEKNIQQKEQEVDTTIIIFTPLFVERLWYAYRFLYRCWVLLMILLFCMNFGGYVVRRETFFCMTLVACCGVYPFIQWDKQSFGTLLGALFFLGFASTYCMLSDSTLGYASWWKRTFARICALSIAPLFVYWYVSTTIENPPSDEVAQQHQEGG